MKNEIPEYPETALDVCCGSRMFYFNKNAAAVHFNDWREPLLGDQKGKTRWLIFFKDGREELACID
ncbi:hypothetical protein [uncultured Veillonella sp.]|uniref:hypothetical protein n=1 Tax=uncultured Veillonella sp. TaxID=159268 RepID=UPI0025890DA0|nr:hypothetical protein [uncultured Veillonella sp.]